MQVLNISFYLLCVKYSMLLISDVVVVVRSFIIYIFQFKTNMRHFNDKKNV